MAVKKCLSFIFNQLIRSAEAILVAWQLHVKFWWPGLYFFSCIGNQEGIILDPESRVKDSDNNDL